MTEQCQNVKLHQGVKSVYSRFVVTILLSFTNFKSINPLPVEYFLNGILHLQLLELSIIIFRDNKMKTLSWSANSIEPGQTAWMCRQAWFCTSHKD